MTPKRNGSKCVQTQNCYLFRKPWILSSKKPNGSIWICLTFLDQALEWDVAELGLQPFWWGNIWDDNKNCSSKKKLSKCKHQSEIKGHGIFCESASIWHKAGTLETNGFEKLDPIQPNFFFETICLPVSFPPFSPFHPIKFSHLPSSIHTPCLNGP